VECAGNITLIGDVRNAYKFLTGKPERKEQLGRLRRR
jgi:hypothetical protein